MLWLWNKVREVVRRMVLGFALLYLLITSRKKLEVDCSAASSRSALGGWAFGIPVTENSLGMGVGVGVGVGVGLGIALAGLWPLAFRDPATANRAAQHHSTLQG